MTKQLVTAFAVILFSIPRFSNAQTKFSGHTDVPIGTVIAFAGQALGLPEERNSGWYVCDGSSVSTSDYPEYTAAVGSIYGTSLDGKLVYLPDFRGLFLRGVSGNRTDSLSDPDAASRFAPTHGGLAGNQVGSLQADVLKSHMHPFLATGTQGTAYGSALMVNSDSNPANQAVETGLIRAVGGNETRPKNAYVYWLIKVK